MLRSKSRAPRKTAFIKAQMKGGEEWLEITIGNISATGLMAKSQTNPPVASVVEVRRRGAVIIGQVVWSTRTRFGLKSSEPIDVEALTAESGLDVGQARSGAPPPPPRRLWRWRERP